MGTGAASSDDPVTRELRPCTTGPGRALTRLEPWLLLLLAEASAHGYGLLERLRGIPEAPDADTGHLYRTLRRLEDEGLVTAVWETQRPGPARRRYTITETGEHALDEWAAHIGRAAQRLGCFLQRHGALPETDGSQAADHPPEEA